MATDLGTCAQCARVLFIIINLLFVALGLTSLGIGIWFVVQADNFGEALTGSGFVSAGALFIIVGGVTFIVAALGCLGAACKLRSLLLIYVIVIVIIIILEIAAAIVAFVFREEITDEIADRMRVAIADFREPDDPDHSEEVNDGVEFVQRTFDCCGADNATDWLTLNPNFICLNSAPPPSCDCNFEVTPDACATFTGMVQCPGFMQPYNFTVWSGGCIDETRDDLETLGYVVGGIAIAFGAIEILGLVLALGLCIAIHQSLENVTV